MYRMIILPRLQPINHETCFCNPSLRPRPLANPVGDQCFEKPSSRPRMRGRRSSPPRGIEFSTSRLPEIGGKGLFTQELEMELLSGAVHCAVHSLKDLPVENPAGLTIGCVPARAEVRDALVSKHGYTLATLPKGATVGTSSLRRAAQLLSPSVRTCAPSLARQRGYACCVKLLMANMMRSFSQGPA